jgi:hypothetical protein
MNRNQKSSFWGPQWLIGVALAAGSLASACSGPDVADDQTEGTQGALKAISADPTDPPVVVKTPPPPPPPTTPPPASSGVLTGTVNVVQLPPAAPPAHPVCGKTVRITSADVNFALRTLLGGTRIMYDTTGSSPTLYGPVYQCFYPNQAARDAGKQDCLAGPPQSKGQCLKMLDEEFPNIKTCVSTSGPYHSYVDFGPQAEQYGAVDQFFVVDTIVRDTWAGRVDLDINMVNTTIGPGTLNASFGPDAASDKAVMNVSLDLTSNDPTILCRHFVDCPNVELTDMRVDLQLTSIAPTPDRTQLGFAAPQAAFHFDRNLENFPDWLADIFTDIDKIIRSKVEGALVSAFDKDKTRGAVNKALSGLAEYYAKQKITTYYGAWYDGGDLVVDYEPNNNPLAAATGCAVLSNAQ